mmetsp:Transcript_19157/g.34659  ORF Transcript_19157/g.34659 Transcript_19157/m.34659 type:complete len:500 (-) Transcript_19157:424-1923(-)|eukprot:CAMPEP_0175087408 /NCGR_PEP_ID=MMETSP0052_2-20121109/29813_1 /TAXON_ID=51329 ORGANISM="Polytomella parva, Strain SAG 63-3" /NCGR_SAMPLE_ID=MMETSP0052_2 /ASSEMBLY_ACC=CAM_ASM_000194 /LENGTH=499 /DNA_ID=CAMNT_0016359749 /DNA_START=33 /DNA_END=1532 /DNA_ORIENTATION=-
MTSNIKDGIRNLNAEDRFLKGVAVSVWQNSGDNGSNWTRYALAKWPFSKLGVSTVRGKYNIDTCSDFWNNYEKDIKLTASIGSNTFRFSFEWARIEPRQGVYDVTAIKRYDEMLDCMEKYGIEPNATLWHFTHPVWFDDLGGFTKEENIPFFVNYSKKMFEIFGKRIKFWATFNEPSCAMFLGFIVGIAPPGKILDLMAAGRFLSTMLKCHESTYHALKAMPGGAAAMVGLVSHHITFEPASDGLLHYPAKKLSEWMTYWWGWEVIEHWMLTGEFKWKLPLVGTRIHWRGAPGKGCCDWWGINYYSRGIFTWHLLPGRRGDEVLTDMYYPIYPDGMFRAIERCSEFGLPMYITETGIADAKDDRRALMIDAYMKAVLRAVAAGHDVRGFYYWTLVDNLEWSMGYTMRFGLFEWQPDGSVDRRLKEGSKTLVRYFRTLPESLAEVKESAQRMQAVLGEDLGVEAALEAAGVPIFHPETEAEHSAGGRGTGHVGLGIRAIG